MWISTKWHTSNIQLLAKMFIDTDFGHNLHISQYDHRVNREFGFMNLGFYRSKCLRDVHI